MITNSGELYSAFRSDVADEVEPFLWSDTDVYTYMNDAYVSFVRFTGGISDSTSAITQIPVVTGEATAVVSPLILKFRQAFLTSTGEEVAVINDQDAGMTTTVDYGHMRALLRDTRQGPVKYMMVGLERTQAGGLVRWVQVPAIDDNVELVVYRLPLDTIAEGDESFIFPDIGQEHIDFLLMRMKARAYEKQDTETVDAGKAMRYQVEFKAYTDRVKVEWERYKHKPREIVYGGI